MPGFFLGLIFMPLKKFCAKFSCHNLCDVGQRYCAEHAYLLTQQNAERNRQYDQNIRHRRDKKYAEFYHSPEWIRTREYILNKHNRLDLYAYYTSHQIIIATTVHHIIEIKEDWNLRLDTKNLIPVSDESHSHIHALYRTDRQGTQVMLRGLIECWNREMKG